MPFAAPDDLPTTLREAVSLAEREGLVDQWSDAARRNRTLKLLLFKIGSQKKNTIY